MNSEIKTGKKNIWQQPWGYAESFIIAVGLFFIGLMLEILTNPKHIILPGWPDNLYISASYITALVLVNYFYGQNAFVRWLSNIPACISAITLYTLISLVMGVVHQNKDTGGMASLLGFTNITNSWYFIFATIYLLTCLGLVILRRLKKFNSRNIGFLINHLGLWVVIFASSVGSGDLKTYQVNLEKDKISYIGYSLEGTDVKLPFGIKLINFSIEEFPPKLALVDRNTGKIKQSKNNLFLIEKGAEKTINNFKIKIKDYLPLAVFDTLKGYISVNNPGAAPAAFIEAHNLEDNLVFEGWITCGGLSIKPVLLDLKNNNVVIMASPEPKKFKSIIEITSQGNIIKKQIEVNKPFKYMGWGLYQVSYDKDMGKYSKISILDAVHDPWLPVVYAGFYMLIAGALYLFWIGKRVNPIKQQDL